MVCSSSVQCYFVRLAKTEEAESSSISAGSPLKSSRAQNNTPVESQDEDDDAVEELMYPDDGEEPNVGIGTVFETAQVEPTMVDSQEPDAAALNSQAATPDHAFTLHNDNTKCCPQGNVHTDSFAPVGLTADANVSASAPTTSAKTLDCQGKSNESRLQSVEDLQGSNPLLNNCTTGPSEELRHVGPIVRWDPAPYTTTRIHSFPESQTQITPNGRDTVDSPLLDPTSDPALDCSQEVCIRAADGAAAGGGSPSAMPAAIDVDPRAGCLQSRGASLPGPPDGPMCISPPQVAEEGAPQAELMSVDDDMVRFMEMTLNGMAQVQDGFRGVFAIQKRRRAVQKRKMAVGDT